MDGRKQKEWEEVEEHMGLKAMEISSRGIQVFSEIGFWIRNWCMGYLYNSGTLKRSAPACDSGVNQEPMEVLLISNFCLSSSPKVLWCHLMQLNLMRSKASSFNYHQIIITNCLEAESIKTLMAEGRLCSPGYIFWIKIQVFFSGIRQAKCEHEQHAGYLAMAKVRVGGGGEPLPMVWQTGVSMRGGPNPSAVANWCSHRIFLFSGLSVPQPHQWNTLQIWWIKYKDVI